MEEAYERAYLKPSKENLTALALAVLEEAWQIPGRHCRCLRCEEQLAGFRARIEELDR